jgi:hypothetical protein
MAEIEEIFKGNIAGGLAVGVGVALLAPVVKPLLRPVAKSVLRAGIAAYDQGRVMFAELNEQAGDVIAEVRAEIDRERTNGKHDTREPSGTQAAAASTSTRGSGGRAGRAETQNH